MMLSKQDFGVAMTNSKYHFGVVTTNLKCFVCRVGQQRCIVHWLWAGTAQGIPKTKGPSAPGAS